MAQSFNKDHRGLQVVAVGDAIKAMLVPLEGVCRYRERRDDDTANFDVTPGNKKALGFSIAIAPGGINLSCNAFSIKELAVEQTDIIIGLVEAILAGRVRQVRQVKASGAQRMTKAYVFDREGRLLFKNRKSGAFSAWSRPARTERIRFAAYA